MRKISRNVLSHRFGMSGKCSTMYMRRLAEKDHPEKGIETLTTASLCDIVT